MRGIEGLYNGECLYLAIGCYLPADDAFTIEGQKILVLSQFILALDQDAFLHELAVIILPLFNSGFCYLRNLLQTSHRSICEL